MLKWKRECYAKLEEKDEDERIGAEHFPESKKEDKDSESPG